MTAQAALELHGFSWERLEKLARKALHDRMRHRRISLDVDRYEEALDWYVEVGARWAREYDPLLAGGRSFPSSCYQRMYPRLTDYLRKRHGDERRGTPLHTVATDRMPDAAADATEDLLQAVDALGANLSARTRWTLEHLGLPMGGLGLTLGQAAANAGVTVDYAEELLEELGHHLGRRHRPLVDDAGDDFALMEEWVA